MPLPPGTWKANVNGTVSDLAIAPPSQQGVFQGQFAGVPIRGFWDEFSQSIEFSVTVAFEDAMPSIALFKGYLFRTPSDPQPGQDVVATLTGLVQMTVGSVPSVPFPTLPTARRHAFGWVASLTEVV